MTPLARHSLAHPRLWLAAVGLVTLAMGVGLLRLELRTDGAALHPVGNAILEAAERDRQRFLDPRQVVLLAHAPPGAPPLDSPTGFRFLDALHRELRGVSAVRSGGVVSIAGLLRVTPETGGLSLGTWLDDVPDDPEAFAELVARTRAVSQTDGLLLSPDGRLAAYYVPLSEDGRVEPMIHGLQEWIDGYPAAPFELSLCGPQVAEATLGGMVLQDLAAFVPIMMVVIAILLAVTLRSPGGVLIPLAETLVVLIWVFGSMGWLGVPVTLVTTILPVVLMAMAITDELHLLERVQARASSQSLAHAVETAISEVGRPIVATSITTALGFLSFLSASVVPLRQFGVWAALGILLAMLLTFCWIPALIVSLPRAWFVPRARPRAGAAGGMFGGGVTARPGLALGIGLLAVAACAPGVLQLRVQDAWIENFAPDAPLVAAEDAFNEAFWGSYRFDVVVEAQPDFFYGPAGAGLAFRLREIAEEAPHVGGVMTYLEPLGEVARALGEDAPLSSLSPLRLADIATVAEMGENRLGLRQLLTDGGEATRARLFANRSSYERARSLWDYLEERLPQLATRYGVTYHYSGDLVVALAVVESIVGNQLRSIGLALATVGAVLLLFIERGRGALVAMVPVLTALVMIFGGMGYVGIPIGIATSMFAALTVGIGVDFGIHFLHRYRHMCRQGLDRAAATAAAVRTTGRVLRWNAIVLALGFLVLTLSSLGPNRDLGLLLSAAIVVCYANALLFLPRLLPLVGIAAVLIVSTFGVLAPSVASAADCQVAAPPRAEPEPEALMAALERNFRRDARVVRMDIRTDYSRHRSAVARSIEEPNQKTLWGVFDGDPEESHLLYVFSGPGRLAGTTLLMHDRALPTEPDGMWLYLRTFDIFKKLEPKIQHVMVPGTALTYEDSRGFIPLDKYRFSSVDPATADARVHPPAEPSAPKGVEILGCPRSAAIREHLGYRSLSLRVDPDKQIVLSVLYTDLHGRPLKTYTLLRDVRIGDRFFPAEVRLEHMADGFATQIGYEYWLPQSPPPPSLFSANPEQGRFIDRLRAYVSQIGLGERIEAELRLADERVRQFEEKLQRIHEAERLGRPFRE